MPAAAQRRRRDAAAVVVAMLLVGLPALLSRDGFSLDFTNHLWLVWVQDHAISAQGHPTFFLHTAQESGGVFDPFFMFYGGTLYAVTGALSALLGHSPRIAYVISILLGVAASYGGLLWLARQLGARTWMAHAPAVAFVGGAYYVTNLYGRGAWPEFVATAAIPLLVASGLSVARSPRPRPLPCALLVASTVIATGSHNITLMWGTIAVAVTLVALRLALRRPLAAGRRQLGWLVALLTLAGCVNAWFLLPNVLRAGDSQIANGREYSWEDSKTFNSPRAVLHPLRWVDPSSNTPALYVQAPVWMLAWALGALALLRRRMTTELRRAAAALGAALLAFLALILVEPVYGAMPAVLKLIQIPYRLNTYVALLIAGLVLVAVLAIEGAEAGRARGLAPRLLAGAMTITAGLCAWQLFVPETKAPVAYDDLTGALVSPNVAPRTWYSNEAYLDGRARVVPFPPDRVLRIDPTNLRGDEATLTLQPPPGREPFALTMGAGPGVVDMGGLQRLGRTRNGFTVARRPDGGSGRVRVTFATAGGATTTGRIVSLLALAALVALAAGAAVRSRRRRALGSRHLSLPGAPVALLRARLPALGRRSDAAAVLGAAIALVAPAILSHDGFTYDYTNHLWLVWVQDHAISEQGLPSYFIHTSQPNSGIFDPFFMFYGGTLYAVTGALSVLLGHSPRIAYVLSIGAAAAAAYGALLWLARQLGVRSWMAHAPAVAYVAGGGYFVSNIYGRGAWPEYIAVAAIPLLIASGTYIARAPRLRTVPCVLFVVAAVFATGSHNITLVWGVVTIVTTLACLRLILRRPLAAGRRQLGWLLVLLALGGAVNAWFLLPDLRYAGGTQIANADIFAWDVTAGYNTPGTVFSPLRHAAQDSDAHGLYIQLPVWLLAWALAGFAVLRRRMSALHRRAVIALTIPLTALLALILVEPLYELLPRFLRLIQFPYRLITFAGLLVSGLILVAALAIERGANERERRWLGAGLAAATAVSLALCAWQLFVPDTHQNQFVYDDYREALVSPNAVPRTWYNNSSYLDTTAPVVEYPSERAALIEPRNLQGDSATLTLDPPRGRRPFSLMAGPGPGIVRLDGLERVGRTEAGLIVARRPDGGSGPVRVTFSAAGGWVTAGRAITAAALVTLVALAALRAIWLRRVRRRGPGPPSPATP